MSSSPIVPDTSGKSPLIPGKLPTIPEGDENEESTATDKADAAGSLLKTQEPKSSKVTPAKSPPSIDTTEKTTAAMQMANKAVEAVSQQKGAAQVVDPEKERLMKETGMTPALMKNWEHVSLADQLYGLKIRELLIPLSASKGLEDELNELLGEKWQIDVLPNIDNILQNKIKLKGFFLTITKIDFKPRQGLTKLPSFLSKCTNLESLNCTEQNIKDISNIDFALFPNLKNLNLKNNQLTTPPILKDNKNLDSLFLSGNDLTEPPDLSGNSKLKMVAISENKKLSKLPKMAENCRLVMFFARDTKISTQEIELFTKKFVKS